MRWERWTPLLLVLPSVILVAVFVYGFIGWTGWLSLTNMNNLRVPNLHFVGLENYIQLFHTPRFIIDLKNNLTFILIFIPGSLLVGLGVHC